MPRRIVRGSLGSARRSGRPEFPPRTASPNRMPVHDKPTPPVHLSRSELDRVIRRAAELQFSEGSEAEDEADLSEDEVLRIGKEVGLAPSHVRRALGELRAAALVPALPPDDGPLRSLVGPARMRAERVVPGDATEVEERMVRWLADVESLHAVRRRAGISLWEPAQGFVAQLQRGIKWGGQRYELAQAKQIELSVQSLEEGFALVTLTVDLTNQRLEQGAGAIGGLAAGGAVLGTVLTATVTAFPPMAVVAVGLAAAGVAGAGGVALGRATYRQRAERVRLASEGLLDRLERGDLVKPRKRRI